MMMKRVRLMMAALAVWCMSGTSVSAQEENGFKKFDVKEDFTENGFQWFRDAELVAAGDKEKHNAMTIGWGATGILWRKPVFSVYIHRSRYSKHIFDAAEYFSVCILTGENREAHLDALKYLGSVSGRDEDKIAGAAQRGLSWASATLGEDGEGPRIPYFAESDYVVLCRKMGQTDYNLDTMSPDAPVYGWYQRDGVHTVYEGEILGVLKKR